MKNESPPPSCRCYIFAAAAVICVSLLNVLPLSASSPNIDNNSITSNERLLSTMQIVVLHENFQRSMASGNIKVDEWEKLDFTQPDEDGFGDNIEYEIFNLKSPRSIIIKETPSFPLIPQGVMNSITTTSGEKLRFTLSSTSFYTQDGDPLDRMEVQALAVVIPNANPDYCKDIKDFFYRQVSFGIIRDYQLGSKPDDLGRVPALSSMFTGLYEGCGRPDQPSSYILIPIAYRTRMSVGQEDARWKNIKPRRLDNSFQRRDLRNTFLP